MHTRRHVWAAALALSSLTFACDKPRVEEKAAEKKSVFDLKQGSSSKASQAELEEARRKAGFKSNEDVAAEAKAKYILDSKLYIKGKLADYRKLLDDVRKQLDEVEKAAPKWAKAKDGQAAFEAWNEKYKKDASKVNKFYDEITAKGSEGGDTQVSLGAAMQAWEDLRGDLAPDISTKEGFAAALTDIRGKLDAIGKTLDEIEKDESLVVEPAEGEGKAEGNDAKADEAKGNAKDAKDEAKGKAKDDGETKAG
ncbi:MAG: hypothetical protein U0168_16660 [Nannocystaceae bacterium]|jgi:hypothetical protein